MKSLNGTLRLALFISGGGTTMASILQACADGRLPRVRPALVIASRTDAGGIDKAKAAGLSPDDIVVARPRDFASSEAFGDALIAQCRRRGIDLIGQYGWMPLTPANLIAEYPSMIVNQHPGPLDPGRPDFGGKGMYGRRVHCARLYFVRTAMMHVQDTEVVAHRVTAEYDRGEVLHSAKVPILETDDPVSLQQRALEVEHRVQIEALHMLSERSVTAIARDRPLIEREQVPLLEWAKRIAITLYPKG